MELNGRTVIVTGSGSGIGRALALAFGREGASVVCCARRPALIEETVAGIEEDGGRGLAAPTDVTKREQVAAMVERTLAAFGQIDVLFNNAGSFRAIGGLWEVDPDVWWRDVTVNLLGPMLCCHEVLPHMIARDEGIIINMNGGGATVALAGGSGYGCSKAGLMRMTDNIATELKRVGSSVLAFGMGPGLVRTDMTEYQATRPEGLKWIPGTRESFEQQRTRPPEDCAAATIELVRLACPEISGRNFGAGQDWDKVRAEIEEQRRQR